MEEKLVSREIAELAREKGFDWCVGYTYSSKGLHQIYYSAIYENMNGNRHEISPNIYPNPPYYSAPTQSLLQKWLREVHNKHIIIAYAKSTNKYDVLYNSDGGSFDSSHNTYEEALEEGLLQHLKLIKL